MREAVGHFARGLRSAPFIYVGQLVILSSTALIVLTFLFISSNMRAFLKQWGEQVELTIFLRDEASADDKSKITEFLQSMERVRSVEFVDKATAAKRLTESMGHISANILDDPKLGNPLASSFNVSLSEVIGAGDGMASLKSLSERILTLSGVEDVVYGQGWIENYTQVLRAFNWSVGFILFTLFLGLAIMIHQVISSQIARRHEEIAILELVGATPWQIRRPYLVESIVLALVGCLAGYLAFLGLGYSILRSLEWHLGEVLEIQHALKPLSTSSIVLLTALMILLAALSSMVALKRIATGWSARNLGKAS